MIAEDIHWDLILMTNACQRFRCRERPGLEMSMLADNRILYHAHGDTYPDLHTALRVASAPPILSSLERGLLLSIRSGAIDASKLPAKTALAMTQKGLLDDSLCLTRLGLTMDVDS